MINIDPIRVAIAPYMLLIKLGLAAVLAASMFIGGCNHGADKWQTKYDDEVRARAHDNIEWETIVEGIAERTRKAAEDASAPALLRKPNARPTTNDSRKRPMKPTKLALISLLLFAMALLGCARSGPVLRPDPPKVELSPLPADKMVKPDFGERARKRFLMTSPTTTARTTGSPGSKPI